MGGDVGGKDEIGATLVVGDEDIVGAKVGMDVFNVEIKVGLFVGDEGLFVGDKVGLLVVGDKVGLLVGYLVEFLVGDEVGFLEGGDVGLLVGDDVDFIVGEDVGLLIGDIVGLLVGGKPLKVVVILNR